MRALVGADIDVDIIATDPWQARLLLSDSYGHDRAYLVGDAAHQNPPWGGHGYNTGIGDAVNIAWKVAAVLHGWAPPALLDSYEAERRPVARQTVELAATNMRALSIELGDEALMAAGPSGHSARAAAAIAIHIAKRSEFHSLGLVLGYGYGPDSAAQSPTTDVYIPQVRPGNRLPHTRSADGAFAVRPARAGVHPPRPAWNRAPPLIEAAAEMGVAVVACRPRGAGFAAVDGRNVVLVRPDQHIAWVGRSTAVSPPGDPRAVLAAALLGFAHDTRSHADHEERVRR